MNSDINTELHVKGERVLSEENKKENDGGYMFSQVLLDINIYFLFTPTTYLFFKRSLPNCEPKLREKKLKSNINFECT